MIDTVYIEEAILSEPRVIDLLKRHENAQHIVIERYSEVFNSHSQNFRLQKQNPALILASKSNRRVLPTPHQYETGGGANYYFSHMLNCLYDCRYCFLQGMYRSANYLLFINYEDFMEDIRVTANSHADDVAAPWFFSGYDCDSLAMEPVTGFAEYFLDAFANLPKATLELRTKSTQIRTLLKRDALPNVVAAFSLNPQNVASAVEEGAPTLAKRVFAMQKLQAAGWRIGVRLDPVIWHQGWQQSYDELVDVVFSELDPSKIDSVTLGGFRLPKGYYKIMRKLYPEHWMFGSGLEQQGGMLAYRQTIEEQMFAYIEQRCHRYMPADKLFIYRTAEQLQEGVA